MLVPPRPATRSRATRLALHVLPIALVAVTLLVRLGPQVSQGTAVAVIFVPAILISAYLGGLVPGLLGTAAAFLASDYFLVPPLGTLLMKDPVFRVQGAILVGSGMAISVLIDALHRTRWNLEELTAALQEREERLRVVVESAQEGIVMRQRDGRIPVFNPAAARITGLTASQMQGLTPPPPGWYTVREDGSVLAVEDRPNRVALRTGRRTTGVVVGHHRPDGTVAWCAVNSEPVFRDGESEPYAVVATFSDLTVERRQAAIQRQLEEQLQQSRKLESIGRLAGGIAHDFNNLLTVILGGVTQLREATVAGAAATYEGLDEIETASKRAAELTGQLLAFARKQVIAPVVMDLNVVVQRSEKLLRRVLGEDVELVTRAGANLWRIRCDPGQLDQVILNLAINARDAMPDGGRLLLETANVQVEGDFLARHPFMRAGAYVRLTVADNGAGMTPEVKARAFDPFFTTKPQGKGTGLGLATVYGIVKQSEGYILLDSAVGRGSTFDLYFPRTGVGPPAPSRAT